MSDKSQKVKKRKLDKANVKSSSKLQISPPSSVLKDKKSKASIECITSPPLPLTQPSQPVISHEGQMSQVPSQFLTPVPVKQWPRDEDNTASVDKKDVIIFRKCKKYTQIRTTLKLEIAECKKGNSLLREQLKSLKRDKEQAQSTVMFMQNLYGNLEKKHKEVEEKYTNALSKLRNINKIFNL